MAQLKDIEKLVKELEKFNKQIIEAGENSDKLVPIINELNNAAAKLNKTTGDESDKQEELNSVQKEAQKIVQQLETTEAKIENARTEQNKTLQRKKILLSDVQKVIKEEIKLEKAQENSINSLRNSNKKLRQELDNLSLTRNENKERIKEINKQINENTKLINENSDKTRQIRADVGNYKDSIKEALGEQEVFGVSLNKILTTFTTGAGIVAGVGAAIVGLGKAYASSARGAEDLARASDRLTSITKSLGNRLADATGEGNILDKGLRFIQASILGVANTIESDLQVATLSELRQIEILEIEQERQKKQQLDRAEVLRQIRDDERKSFAERIAANDELGIVITEREKETIAFQEKRLSLFQRLLKFDEGNIELQKEIKRIEFEIADAREEAQGFRSEQLVNEATLQRESFEQLKKIQEVENQISERKKQEAQKITEIQRKEFNEQIAIRQESNEKEKSELEDLTDFKIHQSERAAKVQKEIDEKEAERKREIAERERTNAIEFGNTLFDYKISQLDRELLAAEGNEKKQLQIRQRIARAEKQKALFNIAINTAEGVVEALPNILLSALVGSIGLAQAAIVAAKPIPQFAKGVENFSGGLAIVGEKGRELIQTPKGEVFLANNPALVNLERGSNVITNSKTEAILNDRNMVKELRLTRKAIVHGNRTESQFTKRQRGYRDGYLSMQNRIN